MIGNHKKQLVISIEIVENQNLIKSMIVINQFLLNMRPLHKADKIIEEKLYNPTYF